MEHKLYKPILQDGDHLVKSKQNESRVRGVSQDANNKTTDIIEWEEVNIEELSYSYEIKPVELTPEQQQFAKMIGEAISEAIVYGVGELNEHVIQPWWKNNAKPWINGKMSDVKQLFSGKTKVSELLEKRKQEFRKTSILDDVEFNDEIDVIINQAFDSIKFDMSTEEVKKHIMNLIYHMLGIAHEIKILSNSRIADQYEDENIKLENQVRVEKFLVEKVADNINDLLSVETLKLDVPTSKKLFGLLGGGIRINEEYIPVETEKIALAINSMKTLKETD